MSASSEAHGFAQEIESTISEHRGSDDWNPDELYEDLAFAAELDERELDFEANQYISELSMAMASADVKGFKYHDKGDFDTATLYFFAKDANMWVSKVENEEITPKDIFQASKAYADALAAKDDWEWANLPAEQKEEVANVDPSELDRSWSYYTNLSSREVHKELEDSEKDALNVGGVSMELFLEDNEPESVKEVIDEYWEDIAKEDDISSVDQKLREKIDVEGVKEYWKNLEEDEEGEELLEEYSNQRADALNFEPESREVYNETWWIPHKTGSNYATKCRISRNAELYEATGDYNAVEDKNQKTFLNLAQLPENKDKIDKAADNSKPITSEGQGQGGIIAKFYEMSVNGHDHKGADGLQIMRASASKYYRATLISHFRDQFNFDTSTIASFTTLDEIPIKRKQKFNQWLENTEKAS